MSFFNVVSFPQMADGQIIQYEHDGSFLQEQVGSTLNTIFLSDHSEGAEGTKSRLNASLLFLFCVQIAVSHDGQIQYLPISSKQQIVIPEELEAAAHSAVTG